MFAKKIPAVSAQRCKARLTLDLPSDSADLVNCGNVQIVNGNLQNTCGFQSQYFFRSYHAINPLAEWGSWTYVVAEEGLYGILKESMPTTLIADSFTSGSACVYQNDLVFTAPTNGTFVTHGGSKATKKSTWGCNSIAICSDRLFGVDGENNLCIAPVGQADFTDGIRVSPHTKISAVVAVGKKLYALGDTCYVVEPYHADEIDVTFRAISHGTGVVQTDSHATFGNKVVFATDFGLRRLQSDKVTPIFAELNDVVNFSGSVGCNYGGKYYVSCKRLDGLQERNDLTLILDVEQEKVVGVLDQGVDSICSLGQRLYATKDGALLRMDNEPRQGFWQRTVDFNNSNVKYLDALLIRSKHDVDVVVKSDSETRWYRVKGKNILQRIPLVGRGRTFTVTVQAQSEMKVEYVELIAHRYEV